ncbi:uncharacterized protein LOC108606938 [Drosophila busckii]|uniref:uncharacterized protein LOC108606938 n=1 Tax=Drosophila busckii TaxID=30019 RepID=UPI00083F144E|nr:uncharacterized protein LOC108606938 [Drosophila busckii]
MNRQRFNELRQDRETEELHQLLQLPGASPVRVHALNPMSAARQVSYGTQRTTTTVPAKNRNRRVGGAAAAAAATGAAAAGTLTIPADATAIPPKRTSPRVPFLPRVARLASNNNNNTNNNIYNTRNVQPEKPPARKTFKPAPVQEKDLTPLSTVRARPAGAITSPARTQRNDNCNHNHSKHTNNTNGNDNNGLSISSSSSMSNSSSDLRKIKLAKAFRLPDQQNQSFVYLCKPVKHVKELMMARALRQSNEQLERERERESSSCCFSSDMGQAISSEQVSGYQEELHELSLQLDVVRQRQEHLQQLAAKVQTTTTTTTVGSSDQTALQTAPMPEMEYDYMFQNIPTLQREIELLQQLGEKLEASMRHTAGTAQETATATATVAEQQLANELQLELGNLSRQSSRLYFTPRSNLTLFAPEQLPVVRMGFRRVAQLSQRWQRGRIVGCVRCFGYISEYRIETRTLNELKTADESQYFYLPLPEGKGLQRTTFRKLRENPNVLLQQLRPLKHAQPFNLLEQDAMFFNSMLQQQQQQQHLYASNNDQLLPRAAGGSASVATPYTRLSVRCNYQELLLPAIASNISLKQQPPPDEQLQVSKPEAIGEIAAPQSPAPAPAKPKKSTLTEVRSKVRQVAPLKPQAHELDPRVQAQLLKTVLVGIVQVAVFLVLIMAFTYPDIRC